MKNSGYTYDYFLDAFMNAKNVATELTEGVAPEIFNRKPSEKKWSMGEILSHLVQTGNEYLSQISKGLNKPDEKLAKGKAPFTPNFLFRWFIGKVSPENQGKLPTVPSFKPMQSSEINQEHLLDEFLKLQDELIHLVKKAKLEGLDLDRVKTRNPVVKFMPMSLTACFGITEAHQRRHFEQMRELKDRFS